MAAETIPRRDFLKAAAAGTAIATNLAAGVSEATAQSATPRAPANPIIRPADLVLNSGKVITVDPSFTLAEAIAIFLATAGLITGEGTGGSFDRGDTRKIRQKWQPATRLFQKAVGIGYESRTATWDSRTTGR